MRIASIATGLLAWLFLAWMFLLSMNTPAWMGSVTFIGLIVCGLASVILALLDRKRPRGISWIGLLLGVLALGAFLVIFFVLAAL